MYGTGIQVCKEISNAMSWQKWKNNNLPPDLLGGSLIMYLTILSNRQHSTQPLYMLHFISPVKLGTLWQSESHLCDVHLLARKAWYICPCYHPLHEEAQNLQGHLCNRYLLDPKTRPCSHLLCMHQPTSLSSPVTTLLASGDLPNGFTK